MKNTLENWYSLNKLTTQQYYQLVDLVNPQENYFLSELNLLAQLPSTDTLPNPSQDELTKFQQQRDLWDYEDNLAYWLDKPTPTIFKKEYLITLTALTLLLIYLLK